MIFQGILDFLPFRTLGIRDTELTLELEKGRSNDLVGQIYPIF